MTLTTALSKPFRHLEKYPGVAQEIEKHLEDDHPDRGDTQRSIGFFKSVAVSH
jgi:Rho guanine nucleotide exchange factor 7